MASIGCASHREAATAGNPRKLPVARIASVGHNGGSLRMASGKIVVGGAGGFIGGHLVADLLRQGKDVRAIDIKPIDEWFQVFADAPKPAA